MSIKELWQKSKALMAALERRDVFMMALIILVAIASFGLGRLSALDTGRNDIEMKAPLTASGEAQNAALSGQMGVSALPAAVGAAGVVQGKFVASKSGTKYHYPWCSGAKRIKDENKVWFDTAEAARAAGYTPAANCPGLE